MCDVVVMGVCAPHKVFTNPGNNCMEKAHVYAFKTPRCYYLYDVNTNSIVEVSEALYRFYRDNRKASVDLPAEDIAFFNKMQQDGYFKPSPIEKIEHQSIPLLPYLLETKMHGITLQITQQCNMRCKYCIYSGNYISRKHSTEVMSLETAKKAIDFLIGHSSGMNEVTLGFYGGEPLLHFDLLKKCYEYALAQADGKLLLPNITTNGTLFDNENLKFFNEHNFSVSLSLDGPEEIHDSNRVFAATGKGSFGTILKNLARIKADYPQLYKRIVVSTVIDPCLDYAKTSHFFATCNELKGITIQSSMVSSDYRIASLDIPESFHVEEEREMFRLLMSKLKRIDDEYISQFSEGKFGSLYTTMYESRQNISNLSPVMHHSGPCIPGAHKLFITTDGSFYPCEKVSEASENMRIGHLDTGFDLEKIKQALNIGALTEKECKKCWAVLFCSLCVVAVDDPASGRLSKAKKLAACKRIHRSSELLLNNFCTLKERGFSFSGLEKSFLLIGRQPVI